MNPVERTLDANKGKTVQGLVKYATVDAIGTAMHIKSAWEFAFGVAARIDTFEHGIPNTMQLLVNFSIGT